MDDFAVVTGRALSPTVFISTKNDSSIELKHPDNARYDVVRVTLNNITYGNTDDKLLEDIASRPCVSSGTETFFIIGIVVVLAVMIFVLGGFIYVRKQQEG